MGKQQSDRSNAWWQKSPPLPSSHFFSLAFALSSLCTIIWEPAGTGYYLGKECSLVPSSWSTFHCDRLRQTLGANVRKKEMVKGSNRHTRSTASGDTPTRGRTRLFISQIPHSNRCPESAVCGWKSVLRDLFCWTVGCCTLLSDHLSVLSHLHPWNKKIHLSQFSGVLTNSKLVFEPNLCYY